MCGVYDTFVVPKSTCPYCKAEVKDGNFQSKAWNPFLFTYRAGDRLPTRWASGTFEAHHVCPYCDQYFEAQGIYRNFRFHGIAKGSELKIHDINTKDAKFWAANRKKIAKQYPGEYVYVFNQDVFHDTDREKALDALMKKYPEAVVGKQERLDIDYLRGRSKKRKKLGYDYEGKWIWDYIRVDK